MQAGRHYSHGSSKGRAPQSRHPHEFCHIGRRPPFRRRHWYQVSVDILTLKGCMYNRLALQGGSNAASRWQWLGQCVLRCVHGTRDTDGARWKTFRLLVLAHAKVTWHSGTNRRPEAAGSRSRLDLIRGGKRRNGRGSNQLMSRPALRLPDFDTNLVHFSVATLARQPFAFECFSCH